MLSSKIDISEIRFASASQYDVVGRVFFARDRVFRAISHGAATMMEEFMASELFAELIRRHWIPNTWKTEDVSLPGFAFCVEHERLFDSQAKEWSFEMMKEAAVFTLQLDALCREHGYIIKDALFDNVCFRQGKPCWVDFGSFRREEVMGRPFYHFYFVWNVYVYLAMFVQGADMVARSLMNGWLMEKPFVLPDKGPESLPGMWRYVRPAVWGFDYYVRVKWPHVKVPRQLFPIVWLMDAIVWVLNAIMRLGTGKEKDWNFIKRIPIYKEIKEADILPLHAAYQKQSMVYPLEDSQLLIDAATIIDTIDLSESNRVVLLGNFSAKDVHEHLAGRECTIVSSDAVYVDHLFREVAENGYNINPICTNIFAPYISESSKKHMVGDLVIVGKMLDEWRNPNTPTDMLQPPRDFVAVVDRLAEYTKKYLLLPEQWDSEINMMKIRFNSLVKVANSIIASKEK